jgi:hypothetical protein
MSDGGEEFNREFDRELNRLAFDADPWNRFAKWKCYGAMIESVVVVLILIGWAIASLLDLISSQTWSGLCQRFDDSAALTGSISSGSRPRSRASRGVSFITPVAALRCPLLRPRRNRLRLSQRRVQLARPDRLDQGVDHRRQPLRRPSEDAGLAFLKLQKMPPDPDEEDHLALLVGPPPWPDLLLDFDDGPCAMVAIRLRTTGLYHSARTRQSDAIPCGLSQAFVCSTKIKRLLRLRKQPKLTRVSVVPIVSGSKCVSLALLVLR